MKEEIRIKRVAFADEKVREAYDALKAGKFEELELAGFIGRAILDLKENPYVGVNVPRRLWPKEYVVRFGINNLWKYDLPNGWRLTYSLRGNEVEILSVILEWFSHKDYEKRFGYKTK